MITIDDGINSEGVTRDLIEGGNAIEIDLFNSVLDKNNGLVISVGTETITIN